MKSFLFILVLLLFSNLSFAESPYLVSSDGKYLGNLNKNKYEININHKALDAVKNYFK